MIKVRRHPTENAQSPQIYYERGLDNTLRMGYIEYAGVHRVHSMYILEYTQGKKTLKFMHFLLDKLL